MNFGDFIAKWNGKFCEISGPTAQNQCVDLANQYIRDVLGLPITEWTNAVDFPSKAGDKYDYILNSPTGVPQEGDLIIWQPSPGHIAIFREGDTSRFSSFDQNFPIGSSCHIQEHTYVNVIGWLRAKPTTPDPLSICNQRLGELQTDADRKQGVIEDRDNEIIRLKGEKLTLQEDLKTSQDASGSLQDELQTTINSYTSQILLKEADIQTLQNEVKDQQDTVTQLQADKDALQAQVNTWWNKFTWRECFSKGFEKLFNFLGNGK